MIPEAVLGVVILPPALVEFLVITMARVLLEFNELGAKNACDPVRPRTVLRKGISA